MHPDTLPSHLPANTLQAVQDAERVHIDCLLRGTTYGERLAWSLPTTFEELRAAFHARDGQRLLWLIAGVKDGVQDMAARQYLMSQIARPQDREALAALMAPHMVMGHVRNGALLPASLGMVMLVGGAVRSFGSPYADMEAACYQLEPGNRATFHATAPGLDAARTLWDKPRAWFDAEDTARSLGWPTVHTVGHFLADELVRLVQDPVRLHNARCSHMQLTHGGRIATYETMLPSPELGRLIAIAELLLRQHAILVLVAMRPGCDLDDLARTYRRRVITQGEWTETVRFMEKAGGGFRQDALRVADLAIALAAILRMPLHDGAATYGANSTCFAMHILTYLLGRYDGESAIYGMQAASVRLAALHLRTVLDELAAGDVSSPTLSKPAPVEVTTTSEAPAERPCVLMVHQDLAGVVDDFDATIAPAQADPTTGALVHEIIFHAHLPTNTVTRPDALTVICDGEAHAVVVVKHLVSEVGHRHAIQALLVPPLSLPHANLEVSMVVDGATGESRSVSVTTEITDRRCTMFKRRESDAHRESGTAPLARFAARILRSEGTHAHLHVQIDSYSLESWLRDEGEIWIEHERRRYQVSEIVQADMMGYDLPSQTQVFFFHVRVDPPMPTLNPPG